MKLFCHSKEDIGDIGDTLLEAARDGDAVVLMHAAK